MGYQTAHHGSLGLPCGLYQLMSLTEGTTPLFGCFNPSSAPHPPQLPPTHPPPINSISNITGTVQKPAFKYVACGISCEIIAI